MISILRGLFVPDDSLSPGDRTIVVLLETIAFALGWGGIDRLLTGVSLFVVIPILVASASISYAGFKWPQIKPKIGLRFVSILERVESSRLYRRVIYSAASVIVIVLLVSVGIRVYRHYHTHLNTQATLQPPPPALPTPPQTVPEPARGSVGKDGSVKPKSVRRKKAPAPTPSDITCRDCKFTNDDYGITAPSGTSIDASGSSCTGTLNCFHTGNDEKKPITPAIASVPPSMKQECAPGASCAMSNGQQGGVTAGTYLGNPPPRITVTSVSRNTFQDSLYESKFKCQVITEQAIVLHVKARSQNLIGMIGIDNERPPSEGGMAFTSTSKNGPGYIEQDFSGIESAIYIVTVKTSQPENVALECF